MLRKFKIKNGIWKISLPFQLDKDGLYLKVNFTELVLK
jgi:hypothetical protein